MSVCEEKFHRSSLSKLVIVLKWDTEIEHIQDTCVLNFSQSQKATGKMIRAELISIL